LFSAIWDIPEALVGVGDELTSGDGLSVPVTLPSASSGGSGVKSKYFRRFALVGLHALHDLADVGALDLGQSPGRVARLLCHDRLANLRGELHREMGRLDEIRAPEDDEALDQILELAHVARPLIAHHQPLGFRHEPLDRLVKARVRVEDEVPASGMMSSRRSRSGGM